MPTHPPARKPQLDRVNGPLHLAPPDNHIASVILHIVARDDQQRAIYAFWAVAGRHEQQVCAVDYNAVTGDIRCDIPDGEFPSPESLEPHLQELFKLEHANAGKRDLVTGGNLEPLPPTIKR